MYPLTNIGIPIIKIRWSCVSSLFRELHTRKDDLFIETGPCITWWRHQMETFSALLALCAGNSRVSGVTWSFDVFFDLCPNQRLSKQWLGWWFETLSCSLWRHSNDFQYHPATANVTNILVRSSAYSETCGKWLQPGQEYLIESKYLIITHWGRDQMDAISQKDIFKCISLNENVWIPIEISLKFVPKGHINNIPALVEIMALRRPGDKTLSEPMIPYIRHSASMI